MDSENKTSKSRWLYGILGVLALIIIGLSIKLISLKDDNKKLENEKEAQKVDFMVEVDSLMKAHNDLKDSYGTLSQELSEKDSIIQADAEEIKTLLASQWDYNKIKKKVTALQSISQRYVRQLDSLYTVNRELVAENERIREEYQEEKKQNSTLVHQKQELTDKVNMAATLKLYNLSAKPVRYKGASTETVTDKAARAERVKIDFTLPQNNLVEAGPKSFYVRIADPSKAVICKGTGDEYSFEANGEKLQYTEKIRVNYDKTETSARGYYIKPSNIEMMPGYYFVDIYDENGNVVGQTSFDLK